jgi:ATP-dependent Lon protease
MVKFTMNYFFIKNGKKKPGIPFMGHSTRYTIRTFIFFVPLLGLMFPVNTISSQYHEYFRDFCAAISVLPATFMLAHLVQESLSSPDKEHTKKIDLMCHHCTPEQKAALDHLIATQSLTNKNASNALKYLISLPWGKYAQNPQNLKEVKKHLDDEHYGLDQIKEEILDYFASCVLSKEAPEQILCFVGPPGVGKTSIAESIARALGRPCERIAMGGMHYPSELVGNSPCFSDSKVGRLVEILQKKQCMNPLIILDEIEKVAGDGISATLLEILNPAQSKTMREHFLQVPIDLSKVFFIATANNELKIPPPLRDRMKIIKLSNYTKQEKLVIAHKHLTKLAIKKVGLEDKNISFDDTVLSYIIEHHTHEDGVRDLSRHINTLCAKIARSIVENGTTPKITVDNIHTYLGKPAVNIKILTSSGMQSRDVSHVYKHCTQEQKNAILQLVQTQSSTDEHSSKALEYILSLPWGKCSSTQHSLTKVKKCLDNEHYGLNTIKEKILDYLATCAIKQNAPPQILCLVGPPGVGKTSIAESIARALGRPCERIAMSNINTDDITGVSPYYGGAKIGRPMKVIQKTQSINPLIILDEIDKASQSRGYNGAPTAVLLELLNPAQSKTFCDNFLGVPFDLSNVFFIATANDESEIPAPLRDRMTIIRISRYTKQEKRVIAQQHLIKTAIKNAGLEDRNITFSDEVIDDIIEYYTREAGVRDLSRHLSTLCAKITRSIAEHKTVPEITVDNLDTYLGSPLFNID